MEHRSKLYIRAQQLILFPWLISSVVACSMFAPDWRDGITLVNKTSGPMVYIAVELEFSHGFDPELAFAAGPGQEGYIPLGEAVKVEDDDIMGYTKGDDVRFFLYEVTGGEATLKELLTLTDTQLQALDFRVEIDTLE